MKKRIKELLTNPPLPKRRQLKRRPFKRPVSRLYLLRAVQELRHHFDESQQAFSNRLGVAVRTVARWERETPPDDEGLHKLAVAARSVGRMDLVATFTPPTDQLREIAAGIDECLLLDIRNIEGQDEMRRRLTTLAASINARSDHRLIAEGARVSAV